MAKDVCQCYTEETYRKDQIMSSQVTVQEEGPGAVLMLVYIRVEGSAQIPVSK